MTLDDLRREYSELLDPRFVSFEYDEGWPPILAGTPARIYRVKEKLGSMRVRTTTPLDPIVSQAVLDAELQSENVCELRGAQGHIYQTGGWARARCETHADDGTLGWWVMRAEGQPIRSTGAASGTQTHTPRRERRVSGARARSQDLNTTTRQYPAASSLCLIRRSRRSRCPTWNAAPST